MGRNGDDEDWGVGTTPYCRMRTSQTSTDSFTATVIGLAATSIIAIFFFSLFVDVGAGRIEFNPQFEMHGPIVAFFGVLGRWTFLKPVLYVIGLSIGVAQGRRALRFIGTRSFRQGLLRGTIAVFGMSICPLLFLTAPPWWGGERSWETEICKRAAEVSSDRNKRLTEAEVRLRSKLLVWNRRSHRVDYSVKYPLVMSREGREAWAGHADPLTVVIIEEVKKGEAGQWVSKKLKEQWGIQGRPQTGYWTDVQLSFVNMPEEDYIGTATLTWRPASETYQLERDYYFIVSEILTNQLPK